MDYFYDEWMTFLELQKLKHSLLPLKSWEEPGYDLIKLIMFVWNKESIFTLSE